MRDLAKYATLLLAVPGLLLAHPTIAPAQQPDTVSYSVAIDCQHGAIRSEGTATPYEIVGIAESGEEYSFTPDSTDMRRLTGDDCRYGIRPFTTLEPLPDTVRIRRFRIGLIGGEVRRDALFLDSLQFTMRSPAVSDSIAWDVDGGKGWCISHDPDDAGGDWRHWVYDEQCYPCLEFSLLPAFEGDTIVDGDWRETAAPGYGECPVPAEDEPPPG